MRRAETGADERHAARRRPLSASPLPRPHLRLRGRAEADRPRFPAPRAPTYIGARRLHAFAAGTPGVFLLRTFAIPHAQLAGVGVAIAEIVIGLLAAAGLLTRRRRAGGPRPQPGPLPDRELAHDALLPRPRHRLRLRLAALRPLRRRGPAGARQHARAAARVADAPHPAAPARSGRGVPASEAAMTRRVLVAEIAGAGLAIAGISALLKGPFTGTTATARSLKGDGKPAGATTPPRARSRPPAEAARARARRRACPRGPSSSARATACRRDRRPRTAIPRTGRPTS